MTIRKVFLFLVIIACAVAGGFLLGQQSSVFVNAQKKPTAKTKNFDLLSKIKEEKIKEIKVWETDETEFYAVIRETDEPVSNDSILKTSDNLIIYNKLGKPLYEHRDFGIYAVKTASFKPNSRQIMIETNGGGTDNFLKIIEYKNGKFNDLIDESETQLRGGYFTIPQYRTGNKTAYFNPAQLIVIQQIGGAEENPAAAVFRFQNNKFQKIGSFSMRDLGDLIERQIALNK
jgi:hypothetical protein